MPADTLTLLLDLTARIRVEEPDRRDVHIRKTSRADIPALGRLYFTAYEPGVAGESIEEATADIVASWDGTYGELWEDVSVVSVREDAIVGALLTVKQAPWELTPAGPFIIELFTDPGWRRQGIARALLDHSLDRILAHGASTVALRVLADNTAALQLYASVGFSAWQPPE